jgi:hypothetical protein
MNLSKGCSANGTLKLMRNHFKRNKAFGKINIETIPLMK